MMGKTKSGLSFMVLPLLVSAVIAIVFLVERVFGLSFVDSGILPRTVSGLKGILFAPLVHGDVSHLLGNLSALPVLMGMLTMVYRRNYMLIFASLWISTGLLVWLMGRYSYHIGVSGVIYALASFLVFGGIISRRRANVALALVVIFFYGSMVWGILPTQPHVSWESHLMGGVAGFVAAFVFVSDVQPACPKDSSFDYKMPGFGGCSVSRDYDKIIYESEN